MPTLKQEISDRGIEGGLPTPNEEISIPTVDPEDITLAVALFGQVASTNPQLAGLVNRMGPFLFASLLFTVLEDYQIDPNDPEALIPQASALEAEEAAIGYIRAIGTAMGEYYGERTRTPSDAEIDQDTDLAPVM